MTDNQQELTTDQLIILELLIMTSSLATESKLLKFQEQLETLSTQSTSIPLIEEWNTLELLQEETHSQSKS